MRIPHRELWRVFAGLLAIAISTSTLAGTRKESVDLIIEADYVVTMNSSGDVIEHGAVAIKDGAIVAVDEASAVKSAFRARKRLQGDNRVVMPGLINGHTHSAMTLLRGIADDMDIMEWLEDYIFPAEIKFVNEDFVTIGSRLACLEMIHGGTTTFVDSYFHPNEIAQVVDECGLRAIIGAPIIEQESGYTKNFDDAMTKAEDFVSRWRGKNSRIVPALAAHAAYTVNPKNLKHVRNRATELGVPALIHISESATEVKIVKDMYGQTPVDHLDSIGFFAGPTIGAHLVWPTKSEIPIMAQRGVGVVHNPSSNLKLGSGFSPVPEMLQAGLAVGLGTDGAASNNDLNMWDEIKLASLIHKARLLKPKIMPASTVLSLATSMGARAAHLEQITGSLEVGKRADLIQISLDGAHLTPLYDVISHLVYAVRADDVQTTIVDGKVLMRDRKVLSMNERQVLTDARNLGAKIDAQMNQSE